VKNVKKMRKSFWCSLGSIVVAFFLMAVPAVLAAPAEQTAPSSERNPEKVLAKVAEYEIKEKDVDQVLQLMGPQGAMYNTDQGRKLFLDELVSMRLLYLSAATQGLEKSPEYLAVLENFSHQTLARIAAEKILESVTVSEEDSKKFYDENPDQFVTPEEIHARHILLSDDVTSADTIKLVQGELKKGTSFDVLAERYSIDPSAAGSGGDLGFFPRGRMVPEFEEAAFAMKEPGDVSAPVKSQFGWHIIKFEEMKPSAMMPFDDVKSQITQHLINEKRAQAFQTALDALKKDFKVEYLDAQDGTESE